MDPKELESQSKAAFARLRGSELEPSPFMKTRILARIPEQARASKEVVIWRWIAGLSLATSALALVFNFHLNQRADEQAFAQQAYVIHVDLSGDRVQSAQLAEVELPEGVHFVSKSHPEIAELKKMTLPVPALSEGRSRLPFVVRSDKPGLKFLKLKILDQNNQVIEEKTMSVQFTEKV